MNPADSLWLIPGIIDRLIELHGRSGTQTLSMREISEKLALEFKVELTRNAVIGKARRMGLGEHPEKRKPVKKLKLRRRYVRPRPRPIEPIPLAPTFSDEPLTIYQLRDGDCKFVLNDLMDRPPFMYCGKAAVREGVAWCKEHYDRTHVKPRVEWA